MFKAGLVHYINMNDESKYRKVGEKLRCDQKRSIGNGRFGFVFYGLFEDTKLVAVKRFQRVQIIDDEEKIKREAQLLLKASDHPNILRYFCTEMNDDFMYILNLYNYIIIVIINNVL